MGKVLGKTNNNGLCIYRNGGVFCDTPYVEKCEKCGWNPEVEAERIAEWRGQVTYEIAQERSRR